MAKPINKKFKKHKQKEKKAKKHKGGKLSQDRGTKKDRRSFLFFSHIFVRIPI